MAGQQPVNVSYQKMKCFPVVPYLDLDKKCIIVRILSRRHSSINTLAAQPPRLFGAQAVPGVTWWHHQPGWQRPSGVLLWSQTYPSTELILPRCRVTQRPRQAARRGWQPRNESSRAGRNYWQHPGEQLWAKPKGLFGGTYGLFKSIKKHSWAPTDRTELFCVRQICTSLQQSHPHVTFLHNICFIYILTPMLKMLRQFMGRKGLLTFFTLFSDSQATTTKKFSMFDLICRTWHSVHCNVTAAPGQI